MWRISRCIVFTFDDSEYSDEMTLTSTIVSVFPKFNPAINFMGYEQTVNVKCLQYIFGRKMYNLPHHIYLTLSPHIPFIW